MAFALEHTADSFSVRISGWNSPRLVSYVNGFVYFQVSTCYPCAVCDFRMESLKRTLQDGPHSRFGLSGDEVLLGLHGNRTYNIIKSEQMAFFVFPYAGVNSPGDITDFLARMLGLDIKVERGFGQSMQLPIIKTNYGVLPFMLSAPDLLSGMETLSRQMLETDAGDELMMQQAKNKFLLIAALVRKRGNVKEAYDSLVDLARTVPLEERRMGRALTWGGLEARAITRVLYGYYYNADTVLYIVMAQPDPQLLAAEIKQAYDKTICSHLNDDIDLGSRFRTTVYYQLCQELESQLQDERWSMEDLPSHIKGRIPLIFRERDSDGELVVWLYTLEDPAIYRDINAALVADSKALLTPWMSTVMVAQRYVRVNPMVVDTVTYRGSRITTSQFDSLRMYAVYRDPKFVSTSLSKDEAEKHRETYLCQYSIRKGCKNALVIKYSFFPNEAEVLLSPYTPLLVLRKDEEKKVVWFGVLDVVATSEHLESFDGQNAAGLFSNFS